MTTPPLGLPPDYGLWSDERKREFDRARRASVWPTLRWFTLAMGAARVLRQFSMI